MHETFTHEQKVVVITPNKDGKDGMFFVEGKEIKNYEKYHVFHDPATRTYQVTVTFTATEFEEV